MYEVRKPKINPYERETMPSNTNWNKIRSGVHSVNITDWRLKIVLNKMIETISLITPSPKIQLKSFGYRR